MQRLLHPITRTTRYNAITSALSSWKHQKRTLASVISGKYGQPLHETHPHILQAGELTPGITAVEYHERRARLAKSLPRGGVAVLPSADIKTRSGAVFYEFHQQPDFFYLTGFNEPEALAVISREESELGYKFHLFVRPKDETAEIWDGARSGVQAAEEIFNADEAHDISRVASILPDLLRGQTVFTDAFKAKKRQSAFYKFMSGPSHDQHGTLQTMLKAEEVKSLRPVMNDLRLRKSEAEIRIMRKAGRLSGQTYSEAMKQTYSLEKDLWTDMAYGFKKRGLDGEAYIPVIAGGTNGLSIHYVRNDDSLSDGQLVLVDAGGEYGGYITDITRTWPVNGKFSPAQKDLYQMVLDVQRSLVSLCREDANMTLDKLHRISEQGLKDGLRHLGFNVAGNNMDVLFPHHVGHYIGLDVHDAPGYPRTEHLQEGHCVTMEPGVYVPDDERWPEHFRGMAIRIEDSICVTKEHPFVLTTEAVKEVDDIEALRS
ncbi:Metallopeptidase-like protein 3 [Elsinoe fawcettii]|nr:Metallopeptidase-like protein 3 [Elsinoe fawcettii]